MAPLRRLAMTTTALITGGLLIGGASPASAAEASIPDPALAACIQMSTMTTPADAVTSLACDGVKSLKGIETLTALEDLWLGYSEVDDLTPVANLPSLTMLYLNVVWFPSAAPLSQSDTLRELVVFSPKDMQSTLDQLDLGDQLTSLRLIAGTLTDASALSAYTHLTTLEVSGTSLSDVRPLASLTGLDVLNLERDMITDLSPLPENSTAVYAGEQRVILDEGYVGDGVLDNLPTLTDRFGNTVTPAADPTIWGSAPIESGAWSGTGEGKVIWSSPTNVGQPTDPRELFSGFLSRRIEDGPRPVPPVEPVEPVDPIDPPFPVDPPLPVDPPAPEEPETQSPETPDQTETSSGSVEAAETGEVAASEEGILAQTGGTVAWFAPLAVILAALGALLLIRRRRARALEETDRVATRTRD